MKARVGDVVEATTAAEIDWAGGRTECVDCGAFAHLAIPRACPQSSWRITALPPTAAEPVAEACPICGETSPHEHEFGPAVDPRNVLGMACLRCVDGEVSGDEICAIFEDMRRQGYEVAPIDESRDARIAELEAEVAAVRKIQLALRDVVENKRADRWWDTYNAALTGYTSRDTQDPNGSATFFADAAHGPLKGGE